MERIWLETTVKIVLLLGMLVGLFGQVVPVFPGVLVIWVLTFLYGLLLGFGTLGGWLFVVITLLTIVGLLADNVLMMGKARQRGASWRSIVISVIAGFIGSILVTPIGGIFIALLGLYASEYLIHRDAEEALEVTKSMAFGCGWAFVVRFTISMLMIGLWAIWAWV